MSESNINILAVMAFVSVVTLAVVTYIFISNTRQKITELDSDMKRNTLILKNNLSGLNTTSNANDVLLDKRYSNLFEVDNKDDEDATNDVLNIQKNTLVKGTLSVCAADGTGCKNVTLTTPTTT